MVGKGKEKGRRRGGLSSRVSAADQAHSCVQCPCIGSWVVALSEGAFF